MKKSIKNILSVPGIYSFYQRCIWSNKIKKFYMPYIQCSSNMKFLDIGCGPADILDWLPADVQYFGYDMSEKYIEKAKQKYKNRNASFFVEEVNMLTANLLGENSFDYVFCGGVLHHISHEDIKKIFSTADILLKKGGALITLDPCFLDNQYFLSHYLIRNDRGEFVRHFNDYTKLAHESFGKNIACYHHADLLKLPYDMIVMKYIKA